MKKTIICIDRDGTLIHDSREHLFWGRDNEWRQQVQLLPQAVEGVRLLNTIAGAGIYMITNQAGVAISDFPLLTEERAHEVCRYVVELLHDNGARQSFDRAGRQGLDRIMIGLPAAEDCIA